jgi:murein hydrolase activator
VQRGVQLRVPRRVGRRRRSSRWGAWTVDAAAEDTLDGDLVICDAGVPDRSRHAWSRAPLVMRTIVFALVLALSSLAASADDLSGARKELAEITERLNALGRWFTGAERQQQKLQRELQATDVRIAAARSEMARLQAQSVGMEHELAALARERQELERQRTEQSERIAAHLAAAYRISGEDFFKLLLNQDDPAELERMVRYHRYFSAARLATMHRFQELLAELESNEARTRERQWALERQRLALDRTSRELAGERHQRERLLAALAADAEHKAKEQERLAADRDRLERLVTELARRGHVPDGTAFASRRGNLPWPVGGTLAHRFGQQRAGGRLTWHGIFIAAEAGTPVHAVHSGRVAFADWLRGFGLMAIVDHGDGHMSLYAHADALFKNAGDWVEGGETIAAAGSSGGQDAAGVYFEIRVKGNPADPLGWLVRR